MCSKSDCLLHEIQMERTVTMINLNLQTRQSNFLCFEHFYFGVRKIHQNDAPCPSAFFLGKKPHVLYFFQLRLVLDMFYSLSPMDLKRKRPDIREFLRRKNNWSIQNCYFLSVKETLQFILLQASMELESLPILWSFKKYRQYLKYFQQKGINVWAQALELIQANTMKKQNTWFSFIHFKLLFPLFIVMSEVLWLRASIVTKYDAIFGFYFDHNPFSFYFLLKTAHFTPTIFGWH